MLAGAGLLVWLKRPPALPPSPAGLTMLMLCGVVVRISLNDRLVDMLPAFTLTVANG